MLILLTGINLYWLISEYQRDILGAGDLIGYLIVAAILVGMWFYFNKPLTKNLLQTSVDD